MGKKKHTDAHLKSLDLHIANALLTEHDRGCVLVAAAQIEAKLSQLFLAKCVGSFNDKNDMPMPLISKLLNPKHPNALLGSFWAKAAICRTLGLIDDWTYLATDKVRGLRNDFAHSPGPIELNKQAIAGLVGLFSDKSEVLDYHSDHRSWNGYAGYTSKADYSPDRMRFMGACLSIYQRIEGNIFSCKYFPAYPRTIPELQADHEEFQKSIERGDQLTALIDITAYEE